MAQPTLKDGYLRIANEIVEQIAKTNFSAYESRILWGVIRQTFGWNKRRARITLTHLAEITGLHRKKVSTVIHRLEARTILLVDHKRGLYISLQTDYDLWGRYAKIKYHKTNFSGTIDICLICGSNEQCVAHHILPKKWGGSNHHRNIAHLCYACHRQVHQWLTPQIFQSPQKTYDAFWTEWISPLFRGLREPQESPIPGTILSPIQGVTESPIPGTLKDKTQIKTIVARAVKKTKQPMTRRQFEQRRQAMLLQLKK